MRGGLDPTGDTEAELKIRMHPIDDESSSSPRKRRKVDEPSKPESAVEASQDPSAGDGKEEEAKSAEKEATDEASSESKDDEDPAGPAPSLGTLQREHSLQATGLPVSEFKMSQEISGLGNPRLSVAREGGDRDLLQEQNRLKAGEEAQLMLLRAQQQQAAVGVLPTNRGLLDRTLPSANLDTALMSGLAGNPMMQPSLLEIAGGLLPNTVSQPPNLAMLPSETLLSGVSLNQAHQQGLGDILNPDQLLQPNPGHLSAILADNSAAALGYAPTHASALSPQLLVGLGQVQGIPEGLISSSTPLMTVRGTEDAPVINEDVLASLVPAGLSSSLASAGGLGASVAGLGAPVAGLGAPVADLESSASLYNNPLQSQPSEATEVGGFGIQEEKRAIMGGESGRVQSLNTVQMLYLPSDRDHLSPYQCTVRQHLELFAAQQLDVDSNAQGRNKPIVLGQVGIRCRHCSMIPPKSRDSGSTYYPSRLGGLYQAAQNLATSHLGKICKYVPPILKEELRQLRKRKSGAGGGKKYWADAAQALGVNEDQEREILCFQNEN